MNRMRQLRARAGQLFGQFSRTARGGGGNPGRTGTMNRLRGTPQNARTQST